MLRSIPTMTYEGPLRIYANYENYSPLKSPVLLEVMKLISFKIEVRRIVDSPTVVTEL